ncbi:MAG: potassium-transporting ATPase subunit C, partial [Cyanobacteriota bacterium]
ACWKPTAVRTPLAKRRVWSRFPASTSTTRPAGDLLQDSGSGVDPHISLQAARQQLPRLARERQLSVDRLEALLRQNQEGPISLQAIEPVVNVLTFNLALDKLSTP